MKRCLLSILTLLLLTGCAPRRAQAQFIGYTAPQTIRKTVLTAASSPTTINIDDVGQNMHFLAYTKSGTISLLDLRIEGSNDGVTFFPISDDAIDISSSAGTLYALGWYTVVRVNLVAITGGGTISATYSGTSSSSSPPVGTYTTGMQIRKVVFSRASQGASLTALVVTPSGSTSGFLLVESTQGTNFPAGSTISITQQVANFAFGFPLGSTSLTGRSFLFVPVTGVPASAATVSYTSGGASANDFSAWYIFSPPSASVDPCQSSSTLKQSAAIAAGAAGTTEVISGVANQSIYVCGYNASQVATAGTILWTTGTGGACGANIVVKSGAMGVTASQPFTYGPGATLFSTAPSSAVCMTTTGAGGTVSGIITFVQQIP